MFQANGTAKRDAALVTREELPGRQPVTVGEETRDSNTQGFVAECLNMRAIYEWRAFWRIFGDLMTKQTPRRRLPNPRGSDRYWLGALA